MKASQTKAQTCLLILQPFTRPHSPRTCHSSLRNLFSALACACVCVCALPACVYVSACLLRGLTSPDSQSKH